MSPGFYSPLLWRGHVDEQLKPAFDTERGLAFARCLIHIIPVGVSVGVVMLSFVGFYYADVGTQHMNMQLGALQFAAKVHEILIAASLSTVVLHQIQTSLLGDAGVPFSLLTAGHQLERVFRRELWTGLFGSGGRRRPLLAALVVVAVILAATSGPASAIAMIPKLNWWEVSNARFLGNHKHFLTTNPEKMWPNNLTERDMPWDCLTSEGHTDVTCPSGGYPTFSARYDLLPEPNILNVTNITFVNEGTGHTARSVACEPMGGPVEEAYRASSFSQLTVDILWKCWGLVQDKWNASPHAPSARISIVLPNGVSLKKPQVEVQCTKYNYTDGASLELPHDRLATPPLDEHRNEAWEFDPAKLWNITRLRAKHTDEFSWVDTSSYAPSPSIGAARFLPRDEAIDRAYDQLIACTVDARWVPIEMWLEPTNDISPHQSASFVNLTTEQASPTPLPQIISISPGWAKALNNPVANATFDTMEGLLANMMTESRGYAYMLSLIIADGLARVNSKTTPFKQDDIRGFAGKASLSGEVQNGDLTIQQLLDSGNWTEIHILSKKYGFGYGLGGPLIKIAIVILFLHAAIAIVHTITVLTTGWTSGRWTKVEELIALAINSPPTKDMDGTCAGISGAETWKKVVSIRERVVWEEDGTAVGEGHLDMVIGDEGEVRDEESVKGMLRYRKAVKSKMYGKMPTDRMKR
ncbi:hypothetical protein GP486_000740 [Trichoglossum hirsutum]|uniref:Uncharacterized protein n=1 Tax=Trichoglossum hirsutum TaxID=265104 RepID=A0A9P8RTP5_9PEZI|nr:hypothetical protein GP486_000740 [Trichoglossum hirsutum]